MLDIHHTKSHEQQPLNVSLCGNESCFEEQSRGLCDRRPQGSQKLRVGPPGG